MHDLETVSSGFRPHDDRPPLPALDAAAGLDTFLTFAMLNRPDVAAAYYQWAAAVQRITAERSLPYPRLTFSMDIERIVMAIMPGLMMEFPGPGKLGLRADVASAEADGRYQAFAERVLQAAFDVTRTYYALYFLTEKLRVNREALTLVADLEALARTLYTVDRVTYQDVLRAQIERDQLLTAIESLEDSRRPLLARWKAALGIHPDDPDPPVPARFESTPLEVDTEQVRGAALARNPRLRAAASELLQAEAAVQLARREWMPDFDAGVEVDVKGSPVMVRPQAGMTLPIWRDKIAAEIAAAVATRRGAQARLSAEQIELAVTAAERLFDFRDSTRTLRLLHERLLPKARESLEVARAGYLSGKVDFFNLIDSERTLLQFQLAEIDARTQRETVAAELSFLVLGTPPASAPLLTPAASVSSSRQRAPEDAGSTRERSEP